MKTAKEWREQVELDRQRFLVGDAAGVLLEQRFRECQVDAIEAAALEWERAAPQFDGYATSAMRSVANAVRKLRPAEHTEETAAHQINVRAAPVSSKFDKVIGTGTVSVGVITLTAIEMSRHFEPGMVIVPDIEESGDGFVMEVDHVRGLVSVSPTFGGLRGTPAGWRGTMRFRRGEA